MSRNASLISNGLKALAIATVTVAGITAAQAQAVVGQPRLSALAANQVVGDTVAYCAQKKYNVVAVIVDLNGVRLALLRGDGSPIHSMDNAYNKAYSAASLTLGRNEDSLRVVAERMKKNPPSTLPPTPLPNVSYALGGIAIKAKGQIIGGLGVSGAPGGQFDEECGNAALAKIKDQLM